MNPLAADKQFFNAHGFGARHSHSGKFGADAFDVPLESAGPLRMLPSSRTE